MPASPSKGAVRGVAAFKNKPSRKSGDASLFGKIARDFGNAARQAPGGVVQVLTALDQALPANPIKSMERSAFERGGNHLNPEGLKQVGRAQLNAIKALKDPRAWSEHPGDQILTSLGLLPIPGAAVGKLGKISKAGKVTKPATRKIKYRLKDLDPNSKEQKAFQALSGRKDKPTIYEDTLELPESKVWTTRQVVRGIDKVRSKSDTLQRRKVERGLARNLDILARRTDKVDNDLTNSIKALKRGDFYKFKPESGRNRGIEAVREVNSGIRGLRLYRPGYVLPNALGSRITNYIQMGPKAAGQSRKTRELTKGLDSIEPGLSGRRDVAMGDSGAQAVLATGAKNPDALMGPVGTLMGGVGQSLSKATDRGSRRRAFDFEAAKQGYDTPEKVAALLRGGNSKLDKDFVQVVRRAEPAAIKFTRNRPLPGRKQTAGQAVDRVLAENIFLYKWLTGSAGYTGRMLTDHPTLTGALAAQSQDAPKVDEIIGKVPEFLKSYVPYAKQTFDKFPKVSSTRALTLFDSPGEFLENMGRARQDPLNLINNLNPVQHATSIGFAGREPYFGAQPEFGQDATAKERLLWALNQETKSIPHLDTFNRVTGRKKGGIFPLSKEDALKRYLLGGFVPIPVDPKVASATAKRIEAKAEARDKRRQRGKRKARKGF